MPSSPRSPRPTMRTVAAAAGVSFKTVSRVVNGEAGVSPELTARVERAIAELEYRPDQRARLLRRTGSSTATIGFVMVDVANPFFSSLLRGIEEVATARDSLVVAASTENNPERQSQVIKALIERRVDGFIVVPSNRADTALDSEIDRGTPVVFVDIEPERADVDLVRTDHFRGARTATCQLIEHGHTRIAYFGDDPAIFSARLRLDGYRAAMAEAGLPMDPTSIVTGALAEGEWHQTVLAFFAQHPPSSRPTAIVTAQNFVTIGAGRALHQLGLRHAVAQIGFDDVELADIVEPGISVVPQHPRQLGRRAADVLFDRIDGSSAPPVRHIIEPPIIQRGSGEIRPTCGPDPA